MAFRDVSDNIRKQAASAIDSAARGTLYEEFDNAEFVAAGSAIALERGAPRLMASSYDVSADRYLEQGTGPWRHLHESVSRFIETDLNESEAIKSRGDGVKMVVSEVLQKVSAKTISQAVDLPDFQQFLNPEQKELMEIAKADKGFKESLDKISYGDFGSLSPEMSGSLKEALNAPLTGKLGEEVALSSKAVNSISEKMEALDEKAYGADGPWGMLAPISFEDREAVVEFHKSGTSTGVKEVDAAMTIISDLGKIPENLHHNDPIMIAQARLLQPEMRDSATSPSDLVSMAITDAAIMSEARKDFLMSDMMSGIDSDIKGQGEYHLLEERDQESIERHIVFGLKTPALDRVRAEIAVLEDPDLSSLKMTQDRLLQRTEESDISMLSKNANELLKHFEDSDEYAVEEMRGSLISHKRGELSDQGLAKSAEFLVQRLDDKSMSGTQEWENLSKSVDKVLGNSEEKKAETNQSMAFAASLQQAFSR